jgi:putative hydrolase of HD superfamily
MGARDPESVAEHSLRVSQRTCLVATIEGAEPAHAALLAIWHDSQETRTGNLPHTARPYLNQRPPKNHC